MYAYTNSQIHVIIRSFLHHNCGMANQLKMYKASLLAPT